MNQTKMEMNATDKEQPEMNGVEPTNNNGELIQLRLQEGFDLRP